MPRLSEFYGIVIYMYFNDHNPPHFHVLYAEHEAQSTTAHSSMAHCHGPRPHS